MSGADVYRSFKTNVAMTNNNEHHAMQKFHIPSAAAAIHLLCRVETRTDLMLSTRQLSDARYQLEANGGLVSRFVEGLSPKARCSMHGTGVISDFIPYCLWILSAGYGSVALNRAVSSLDILNKFEKTAFEHHVGTLRALGLTYVKSEDNSFGGDSRAGPRRGGMRLEPEIDLLAKFEGLNLNKRRKQIPSVLKELLAHGANLEEMRERERASLTNAEDETVPPSSSVPKESKKAQGDANGFSPSKTTTSIKDTTNTDADTSKTPPSKAESSNKRTPAATAKNFLGIGAANAKKAKTARKAALVGFNRSNKRAKLSHSGSGRPLHEVIKFKYQKGFTQAVRVPCQMEDLL
jgi:chromosome transmission fidelity protein 18